MDTSNDYFRQLFLAGELSVEHLFWMEESPFSTRQPDDRIHDENGALDRALILQPGDVHWAYVTGQGSSSNVARPLVLDPFLPGSHLFDPDWLRGRAVVVRIDGSAKALTVDPEHQVLRDHEGQDVLSPLNPIWDGEDPRPRIAQPEPAP